MSQALGAAEGAVSSNSAEDDVDALLQTAVLEGDPAVLKACLYYITGDERLLGVPVRMAERRGGAFLVPELTAGGARFVREEIVAYLKERRRSGDDTSPTPRGDVRTAMETLAARTLTDEEFRFAVRELGLESQSSRSAAEMQAFAAKAKQRGFRVVIVGAGLSGLGMAIELGRIGVDYVVIEQQERPGGVWVRNQFPEARIDTTSFVYQFTTERDQLWSEHYPTQAEVQAYAERLAVKHGVTDRTVYGTKLISAQFDEDTSVWKLVLEDAQGRRVEEANVVVSAAGLFTNPKIPDIPGLDTFAGRVIHSAAWEPDFDPTGLRVAILGNGSTGVQIMPWLAERADVLTVFQRTPQWISPLERYKEPVSEGLRLLLRELPYFWSWTGYAARAIRVTLGDAQEYDRAWQAAGGLISRRNDGLRENLTNYIATKLAGRPDLIAACTPNYAPLARRLVVDNGWYDALLRPNVALETDGIERIEEDAIVTVDGRSIPVDAIVLATGFDVEKYVSPAEYRGVGGHTIEQAWEADGPRAYCGLQVPGFPNFFIMYGPSAQVRGGSFLTTVERWAQYVSRWVQYLVDNDLRQMDITREAFDRYNELLDDANRALIWQTEGPSERNYYVNRHGRQTVNMPWRLFQYANILEKTSPEQQSFA